MSREKMLIKNVTIVDLESKRYFNRDIFLVSDNGKMSIRQIDNRLSVDDAKVIDGMGKYAFPSFCDLWCSIGERGREKFEDFVTGTNAALWGGYGTVLLRPFGDPADDSVESVLRRRKLAEGSSKCRLVFSSAITKGARGEQLCEIDRLVEAGVNVFTDGMHERMSDDLLRNAMISIENNNALIIVTPQLIECYKNRSVNLGRISRLLGYSGIPASAEAVSIARYLILAEETGCRLHVAGISTETGVYLISEAKKRGVNVTASAFPSNFCFTEDDIPFYGTRAKVWPPLRSKSDREAVKKGLVDGTIDCISSDHTPLGDDEKKCAMDSAAFGSTGLQTAFSAACSYLHFPRHIDTFRLGAMFSSIPARILGIAPAKIEPNASASFSLIDLDRDYIVSGNYSRSKADNCIFNALTLRGTVDEVFVSNS